jgi:hypothetical protein
MTMSDDPILNGCRLTGKSWQPSGRLGREDNGLKQRRSFDSSERFPRLWRACKPCFPFTIKFLYARATETRDMVYAMVTSVDGYVK